MSCETDAHRQQGRALAAGNMCVSMQDMRLSPACVHGIGSCTGQCQLIWTGLLTSEALGRPAAEVLLGTSGVTKAAGARGALALWAGEDSFGAARTLRRAHSSRVTASVSTTALNSASLSTNGSHPQYTGAAYKILGACLVFGYKTDKSMRWEIHMLTVYTSLFYYFTI